MKRFSIFCGCLVLSYSSLSSASYTTYAEAQATLGNQNQYLSNPLSPSFDRHKDTNIDKDSSTSASVVYQKIDSYGVYEYRVQSLGTASAGKGVLKAYAGAGWTAGDGYTVSAKADAGFTDPFRIRGPAASNKLVDVLLTLNMHSGTSGNTQASGELWVNNNRYISYQQSTLSPPSFYCAWPVSGACDGNMIVKLPVNTTMSLSAAIAVQAAAASNQPSSTADYSHTASIWLSVLDANYQLISDSGFSYAAPVPLPGAGWLFGSVLFAGIMRVSRFKNRSRDSLLVA
ncbi:hypothetical protein [Methylomonas rosea]|uniref:Secreted protein with PEP-CTERM sorting signal n=1 Tax=Methylomonas rosea TaxID=2952227 RepID=A0ABT1TNY5_9GAMM|nr:hypothetical protein [Methylomonas sp. WSC-7]MCQ8116473.1 hypothetical protein [Methylomonas sp. WSC-7]